MTLNFMKCVKKKKKNVQLTNKLHNYVQLTNELHNSKLKTIKLVFDASHLAHSIKESA
jgi:hypothetical protein